MILRRLPESRFSTIERNWPGATVVILGGGPSLDAGQIAMVHGAHAAGQIKCVAVNDAYLLAPWADAHYAADSHWHKWHTAGVAKPALGMTAERVAYCWADFKGQKCTIQNSGANVQDERVHMLRNRDGAGQHGVGLSLSPDALVTGRNSLFQGLNMAVLAGARKILLLGCDGKPNAEGKTHWHGGHPRPSPVAFWPEMQRAFMAAKKPLLDAGVTVLNCSPGSAVVAFPHVPLVDALAV